MNLALRSIGTNDYAVIDAGEPVGRIRLASERGEIWQWTITVLIPGPPYGSSSSLDNAKVAFKEAWGTFKAEVGPEQLADAFETARAAGDRLEG